MSEFSNELESRLVGVWGTTCDYYFVKGVRINEPHKCLGAEPFEASNTHPADAIEYAKKIGATIQYENKEMFLVMLQGHCFAYTESEFMDLF
jgi:hypothetical protein